MLYVESIDVKIPNRYLIYFLGIKQLLSKLLSQLMGCSADLDLDEEEDHASVSQRKMNCSMASLCGWYEKITKVTVVGCS